MPKTKRVQKIKKGKSRKKKPRTSTKSSYGKRVGKSLQKKSRTKSARTTTAYQANPSFQLFGELRSLIIKVSSESFPELEKKFRRLGKMKLIVVSGVFLNIPDARVDLLLVGDSIQLRRLTNVMKDLEVDLGKEIRYVVLSASEFNYRYEMYDRFLRDILNSPHEKIINRLKV